MMHNIFTYWRTFLKESSLDDEQYREEALSIFASIQKYLNDHKNEKNYGLNRHTLYHGFVITHDEVANIPKNMMIVFKPLGTNSKIGQTKDSEFEWGLSLSILKNDDDSKNLHLEFVKKKLTFVHEFVHFMDINRHKGPNIQDTGELYKQKKFKEYFNSPFEYNAYMQAGFQAVINIIDSIRRSRPKLLPKILGNYDAFEQFSMDKFHKRFLSYLTPENQKRFTKRLYSFYNHLKTIHGIK